MNTSRPLLNLFLGLVAFGIVVTVVLNSLELLKLVGAPFLYLPDRLGLVKSAQPDEIQPVHWLNSENPVHFDRPGTYFVYASDMDLLSITTANEDFGAPWVQITSRSTGQGLALEFVKRGARPYDSALARGRPVFTFTVQKTGDYDVTFARWINFEPTAKTTIALLPDTTTGKEGLLAAACVAQWLILFSPLLLVTWKRSLQERRLTLAERAATQERGALLWAYLKK